MQPQWQHWANNACNLEQTDKIIIFMLLMVNKTWRGWGEDGEMSTHDLTAADGWKTDPDPTWPGHVSLPATSVGKLFIYKSDFISILYVIRWVIFICSALFQQRNSVSLSYWLFVRLFNLHQSWNQSWSLTLIFITLVRLGPIQT